MVHVEPVAGKRMIRSGPLVLVAIVLALCGCTVERHFPRVETSDQVSRFHSDITYCVRQYDPGQLASVNEGLEYNVSGSLPATSNRGKVVSCMAARGWDAIVVPW